MKLRELTGKGYGTYHITNSEHCSWYEFAVERAGLKERATRINPVTSDEYRQPAKSPPTRCLVIQC